jgi:c-di-GMP-binding flagellar brake protein YcgR
MAMVTSEFERRRFRRVKAPVYCRPLGKRLFASGDRDRAVDISQGGLRVYCDVAMSPGERLELELFLPDTSTVECQVEIVWVEQLTAAGAPARFDMGLRFLDLEAAPLERLSAVLTESGAS